MTQHKMTVEVDFDVDESDIISYASDLLADRVEKNAWYHKIREGVDAMVLDEVREKVKERVALALDRGITKEDDSYFGKTSNPGLQNAQTGAGGDWYETMSLEAFIEKAMREEVANQVGFYATRVASKLKHEAEASA